MYVTISFCDLGLSDTVLLFFFFFKELFVYFYSWAGSLLLCVNFL